MSKPTVPNQMRARVNINIVDVISRHVRLTKLGPGYTGPCPFCEASGRIDFKVSVQHQKYTCEKCGASGGVFQFLLDFKNISLEEALNELKESLDIHLDANILDSRWNEILKGTDFQQMLNLHTQKSASLLNDVAEKQHPAKEEPISYTALATFMRCPLEYKLRYRDKIKKYEPAGTRVNLGRFLHSVAYGFLREPIEKRSPQYIHLQFKTEIERSINAEYAEELKRFEEPTSILLLGNFADKHLADKDPHFRTIFGSYTLTGTADCLIKSTNGIEIIEFKEYDYRDFEDSSEILYYLQLLFYYFGLQEDDLNIFGGAYCFFNNGSVEPIDFSDKMINNAKTYIEQKLEELANCRAFMPKRNRLCISCGYKDKCELHRKG